MVWARSLTNQRKLKDSIGCIQCEQPITDTWTFNHKANEFKWNIELLFQSNKPASPHPVGSPSRKPVTRTNGANGKWQHIIHHVTAKTTLSTTADTWLELNIAYFTDTSSQKQQFTCWHQSTQVTICNMLFFWFALPPPPPRHHVMPWHVQFTQNSHWMDNESNTWLLMSQSQSALFVEIICWNKSIRGYWTTKHTKINHTWLWHMARTSTTSIEHVFSYVNIFAFLITFLHWKSLREIFQNKSSYHVSPPI